MSKRKQSAARNIPTARSGRADSVPPAAKSSRAPFFVGLALLTISLVAALLLALEHLGGLSLPGCGPGGPCAVAAASRWGRLPVVNWPVSFVGLAYFAALAAAWVTQGQVARRGLLPIVRAGAAVSLVYLIVIIAGKFHCLYCLIAHLANLGFWLVLERRGVAPVSSRYHLIAGAAVFAAVSLALGATDARQRHLARQRAEAALAASTADIIAASKTNVASQSVLPERAPAITGTTQPNDVGAQSGFTGRYRLGPAIAPIRLVVISDYQCTDCQRIEGEIRSLMGKRTDVSFSAKQFPFCTDCNRHVGSTLHANACWAARAAETAGMLRGADGFWQMHRWLFDRNGSFTNPELEQGLRDMGYDVAEFTRILNSPETLVGIQADIEEAIGLGIYFTPMIFINGVELKGWNAPNAVERAIEAVAATNPPARTAEDDRPPPASKRYVADWREQPVRPMPPDAYPHVRGPADARVSIVVWGDYQEPGTAALDRAIVELLKGGDVRYEFRHFPFDQTCNSKVPATRYPNACPASRSAEAAGLLGGAEGYWKMHDWLMQNQNAFGNERAREEAAKFGLDVAAYTAMLSSSAVADAIRGDAEAGAALGLQAIPMLFVNGKFVPRWQRPGDNVLERIVAEAGRQ